MIVRFELGIDGNDLAQLDIALGVRDLKEAALLLDHFEVLEHLVAVAVGSVVVELIVVVVRLAEGLIGDFGEVQTLQGPVAALAVFTGPVAENAARDRAPDPLALLAVRLGERRHSGDERRQHDGGRIVHGVVHLQRRVRGVRERRPSSEQQVQAGREVHALRSLVRRRNDREALDAGRLGDAHGGSKVLVRALRVGGHTARRRVMRSGSQFEDG